MPTNGASDWHLVETYKSILTFAVEALKMLALVNGGAAVAVLTYLGNLVSRAGPGLSPPDMTPALHWYSSGLAATVFAFIAAYLTQLILFFEEKRRRGGGFIFPWHACGVGAGFTAALFSVFSFWMGCHAAATALGSGH